MVPEQSINADEQKSNFVTLNSGATVQELIQALNALGVTPRDTIIAATPGRPGDHVMTPVSHKFGCDRTSRVAKTVVKHVSRALARVSSRFRLELNAG